MKHKYYGDQVCGGVFLIGLALLFLTGWWWPGILFVIGAAMIARALGEGRPWQSATPAFWVIGIGVVFGVPGIFKALNWTLILAGILIVVGMFMLLGGNSRRDEDEDEDEKAKNDDDDEGGYA